MGNDEPTDWIAGTSELPQILLRYAGTCVACGMPLAKGSQALYDRAKKTLRCVTCPVGADELTPPIDVGVAGASARREYERRVASRDARVRDRLGRRLGGLVLALTAEPQSTRAWARGSQGEQELAEALVGLEDVRMLHDRRVSGTRGNIDHIVVAPAGIFVVDAKRFQGTIRIRDVGGWFRRQERLYVGRRDCSHLAENMAWQVDAVQRALRAVMDDPLPPITPVLCFVKGDWPLLSPPSSFGGVRLESTRSIAKLVRSAQTLDASEIDRLTRILAAALPAKLG